MEIDLTEVIPKLQPPFFSLSKKAGFESTIQLPLWSNNSSQKLTISPLVTLTPHNVNFWCYGLKMSAFI
jgi:hypothetical protein